MSENIRRRALLVGIDTYVPPNHHGVWSPSQDVLGRHLFADLAGSARSARAIEVLLREAFDFRQVDIRLLLDREATRAAILTGFTDLLADAGPGDEVLFYFCGHGAQVINSLSDEIDGLDESLVLADCCFGAPPLRDKELRRLSNSLLDRGASLTSIIDCNRGGSSGAHGLTVAGQRRRFRADKFDAQDAPPYGPRPEERGALTIYAAQQGQAVREVADEGGDFYSAFTLALLKAIGAARPNESAERLFLRTKAFLSASRTPQEPVLVANQERRRAPFLGQGAEGMSTDGPSPVAIRYTWPNGTVSLHGGLANGLRFGCQLKVDGVEVFLRVKSVDLVDAAAEVIAGDAATLSVGNLCSIVGWGMTGETALSVCIPECEHWREAEAFAAEIYIVAAAAQIRWISDPVAEESGHTLAWEDGGWRLTALDGESIQLGPAPSAAQVLELCAVTGKAAAIFVQLPAPPALARALRLGEGTTHDAIDRARYSAEAHYVLAGRLGPSGLEYAWVRPGVGPDSESPLPSRSDWLRLPRMEGREGLTGFTYSLEAAAFRIAQIRSWLTLEAPPGPPGREYPYRLALRRISEGDLHISGELYDGDTFGLVLQANPIDLQTWIPRRYVYVFLIDSYGSSSLLFPPPAKAVEHCFPLERRGRDSWPTEILLGEQPSFTIGPPFGVDTYFLLTTSEPLPTSGVLEATAVRGFQVPDRTSEEEPLEGVDPNSNPMLLRDNQERRSDKVALAVSKTLDADSASELSPKSDVLLNMLSDRAGLRRSNTLLVPSDWSIDRLTFTSCPRLK